MLYKQIEKSREIRLWITQIIVPAFIGGAMILSNDGARAWEFEKADNAKAWFKEKFNR